MSIPSWDMGYLEGLERRVRILEEKVEALEKVRILEKPSRPPKARKGR